MPQIGPNLWKASTHYYWYHRFRDGREEFEFDPATGSPHRWCKPSPDDIVLAGWLPITRDLAKKIQAYGEFGNPTASPAMLINLKPGDDLIIEKDVTVYNGQKVDCLVCGTKILVETRPSSCPVCGASAGWRCPTCGKLTDSQLCCGVTGHMVDPLKTEPHKFETVLYRLGIRGRYIIELTNNELIVT